MSKDVALIKAILREEFKEEVVSDCTRRTKQLEEVYAQAMQGHEKSKEDVEEIRIRYEKRKCGPCEGKEGNDGCGKCGGRGFWHEEVVTKKTTGQAGSSAFLAVAKSALVEICRLRQHYPEKPARVQINQFAGTVRNYEGADKDLMMQQRLLMFRIKQSMNGSGVNGAVDVEFEEKNDDD